MVFRKKDPIPQVPSHMKPRQARIFDFPQGGENRVDTRKRILIVFLIIVALIVLASAAWIMRSYVVSPTDPVIDNPVVVEPNNNSNPAVVPTTEPQPTTEPTVQPTTEPTTQPTTQPTTKPAEETVQPIPIASNFIFTEKDWEKVSVNFKVSGERSPGFAVSLLKGDTVYAPFDGYIQKIISGEGEARVIVIKITTDPDWTLDKNSGADVSGHYSFSFAAKSIDLIANGQVKKGDPLFKMASDTVIWSQYFKGDHSLYVYLGGPWGEITNPSENPKEYLGQIMAIVETE